MITKRAKLADNKQKVSNSLSIVRASAGSGKTYLLAQQYISQVVVRPEAYKSILAVTFTNKATAEMKRRIIEELYDLSTGVKSGFASDIAALTSLDPGTIKRNAEHALSLILHDYSSFSVSTIDKFFQRIVRSFFRELGLDFNYTIQIENDATLRQAVDDVVERAGSDPKIAGAVMRVVGEMLESGSSVDIRRRLLGIGREIFREHYREPGASLEHIETTYEALKADHKASTTALRQKCTEAADMVRVAGLSPMDFKWGRGSFAAYFFKIEREDAIESYSARFEKVAAGDEECYTEKSPQVAQIKAILPSLMAVTGEVKELYDRTLESRATFEALAENFSRSLLLRYLRDSFSQILALKQRLAISRTTQLIGQIATGAEVPFIFEKLGMRYSTIYIDEFQDTSKGQWQGFLPLLHEVTATSDAARSVMLIGDVKQAIYRWRGGDWNILAWEAEREFADVSDTSVNLTTNYRSEKVVVEFNNKMMLRVVGLAQAFLRDFLEKCDSGGEHLLSILPAAYSDLRQSVSSVRDAAPSRGYVSVSRSDDELQWALSMVEELLERGYTPCDIAVLTRTRREGAAVATMLIGEGISVVSDESLALSASDTVAFVIDVIKMASDSSNPVTLACVNRFLGRDFTTPLGDDELKFITSLRYVSPVEGVESVIQHFALQKSEPAYLQALCNEIYTFCKDNSADTSSFLEAWNEGIKDKYPVMSDTAQDAVRIMTIHKAKGLEFGCVVMPYCSFALLPSAVPPTTMWVDTDSAPYDVFSPLPVTYKSALADSVFSDQYYTEGVSSVVDNVNLLYVALTRACAELYLCLPEKPKRGSMGEIIANSLLLMGDTTEFGERGETPIAKVGKATHSEALPMDSYVSYPARWTLRMPNGD